MYVCLQNATNKTFVPSSSLVQGISAYLTTMSITTSLPKARLKAFSQNTLTVSRMTSLTFILLSGLLLNRCDPLPHAITWSQQAYDAVCSNAGRTQEWSI